MEKRKRDIEVAEEDQEEAMAPSRRWVINFGIKNKQ